MEDYNDITGYLKPRRDIKASDELRKKVERAIKRNRRNRAAKKFLGGLGLSAVAAMLLFVLIPSGMSAKELLREAVEVLRNYDNIEMVVEIRTRSVENFRYINVNDDFVTHHINIASNDSVLRWRVDKQERIAVGNGKDIYTWMPSLNLGWHMDSSDKDDELGYLANLLTPCRIMEMELDNLTNNSNADFRAEKIGDDIILTVHSYPKGDFHNPYMLNASIAESENIRRYVIDAASKRLKGASVSVISENHEVEVLTISSIDYNAEMQDICMLDDGIRFVEIENQPTGLTGLSAEEAASTVLSAFAEWDESVIDRVVLHEVSEAAYRERFHGSTLISIGRSFKSGNGSSVFIPYTLKLRDGTLQRHNISLQRTECGGWIVVGGL